MSKKVIFRSRRDPKAPVSTDDLDDAIKMALFKLEDQNEAVGPPGPEGKRGPEGEPGPAGEPAGTGKLLFRS